MTHKTCATCEWFEPLYERTVRWPGSSGTLGGCLRFPPSFIDPHKLDACWPSVASKDRCGEWTPRTSQPEEADPAEMEGKDATKMGKKSGDKFERTDREGRTATRFLGQAHAALFKAAFGDPHDVSAREEVEALLDWVARDLDVDQATISWLLSGAGNPTIRSIGELVGALGYRPELVLHRVKPSE